MFTSPSRSFASSECGPLGISLEKSGQRCARFGQLAIFLSSFCRGLKFRQADIWCRLRRRIRFVLGADQRSPG